MAKKKEWHFTTRILHSDRLDNNKIEHGSLHKPVHANVAFEYENASHLVDVFQNKRVGYAYGRQANPTTAALEKKVNTMEEGVGTICFSTGMAAIGSLLWALFKQGDHLVISQFLFGNTASLFRTMDRIGVKISFVDATDIANVESAITEATRLVFVETIANPKTQIADLYAIGELCAKKNLIYIVDNTLTSPYLFKPKTAQATFSINSLTKCIGGHGDALGGAVTDLGIFDWQTFAKRTGNIHENYQKQVDVQQWGLQQIRKKGRRDFGASLDGFAAHLLSRGADTLALRQEKQCASANKIASFLEKHPLVAGVYHPSLPCHPQHQQAKKWFRHSAAILSFDLLPSKNCIDFLNQLQIIVSASNLADNRSLAIPIAQTIFFEMGKERRQSMGVSEQMIRLSVGIEDADDLIDDLTNALSAC